MPAALGPPAILTGADAYLAALGYLVSLVFLVVFGIWGFRIGSGTRDEDGGGGSSGPDPGSPPPTGGQEVTDHFAAWEEQWKAPEDESAAARRG